MDQQTIDTYDKMAEEYDAETTDFWKLFPSKIIDAFVEKVGTGKVIDIGCGPGRDGLMLKEKGCSLVCLDASQSMLDICEKRGLNTVRGDLLDIPFDDGSFDGAWAYTSFLHIPKKLFPEALIEARRVIKGGGFLVVGMIEGEGERYKKSSGVTSDRYFAYYMRDEIETRFKEAGFEIVFFDHFPTRHNRYLNYLLKKI
ncbi:MAG: hypothetical protein RLY66_235 [Candidatus Parcubacteria bacterium]|jgi:ubiquinone/menaquinone biosynthesis C-methylase UbiE